MPANAPVPFVGKKSSPPPPSFGGDSNRLAAIYFLFVPITTADSSTTSVFEKSTIRGTSWSLGEKIHDALP
jgi:hypothetical protein